MQRSVIKVNIYYFILITLYLKYRYIEMFKIHILKRIVLRIDRK